MSGVEANFVKEPDYGALRIHVRSHISPWFCLLEIRNLIGKLFIDRTRLLRMDFTTGSNRKSKGSHMIYEISVFF